MVHASQTPRHPLSSPDLRVLFYRDFQRFTGGHLKVWHYYEHVRHAPGFRPLIAFSAETRWDATNPWLGLRDQALAVWDPTQVDFLFLAGMDWTILTEAERRSPPRPVINFIQHVRHANPAHALYGFLPHPAVRICVSPEVAEALKDTGRVNGPIVTIPNGIDLAALPLGRPWTARGRRIVILGIKQPAMALELRDLLSEAGFEVDCLVEWVPREECLSRLAQARLAVLLPNFTEGFYLPALEAMALGTPVVCPDCRGNRSFCLAGENCWQPAYTSQALCAAVDQAFDLPAEQVQAMVAAGLAMARGYPLGQERQTFLHLLQSLAVP